MIKDKFVNKYSHMMKSGRFMVFDKECSTMVRVDYREFKQIKTAELLAHGLSKSEVDELFNDLESVLE